MNRFIKTALAALLVISMTQPVFAAPASDTDTGEDTEITEISDTNAENGGENADENAEPSSAPKTRRSSFSDINTANFAWAKLYILDMADQGYISGYEDGTYRPDNDVTRLEAIALFGRAMGSVDEANKPVLEIAHERYDSIIKNYRLSWGTDETAFMMYKGALKKTDLDTYLKDEEKNIPMARYEAAIIITKAMGGEDAALSDLGVVLDYTDARDVPANAIQYVAYVTEQGIMEGMDDGSFSPNTPVKRSQMAVMLSRTAEKMDYSFEDVHIVSVDTADRKITVSGSDDKETAYAYTSDTVLKNMGDEAQPADLDVNVDAVITLSGKKLVSVETISDRPDEIVKGKYVSYASTSGKTTVRITLDDTGESESFECDRDISVTYDGSPATVRSFNKGDVVVLELHGGKVVKMSGDMKETVISGAIVEDIDISEGVTITISHGDEEYNGKTYPVSSDVKVKKNDATVGLDSIYKGDKVRLTLQYDEITEIRATSTTKTVEGTIQSLTIASPQSSMTVRYKGEDTEYMIPNDVEILINGSEGSLYEFRVGDTVKVTTESGAITKIVATSTQESSGNITGVVTAINASFGFISVRPDGSENATNVYCKDETTTFVAADGKSKKLKDIKVGQTVEARGTVSNGAFVGKLVVILSEE